MRNPSARREPDEVLAKELADLYQSGLSLIQIQNRTKMPKEKVRGILHQEGVQMRHVRMIYHEPRLKLDFRVALLLGLHAGNGHLSDS